jgi:hypothetical protein
VITCRITAAPGRIGTVVMTPIYQSLGTRLVFSAPSACFLRVAELVVGEAERSRGAALVEMVRRERLGEELPLTRPPA